MILPWFDPTLASNWVISSELSKISPWAVVNIVANPVILTLFTSTLVFNPSIFIFVSSWTNEVIAPSFIVILASVTDKLFCNWAISCKLFSNSDEQSVRKPSISKTVQSFICGYINIS